MISPSGMPAACIHFAEGSMATKKSCDSSSTPMPTGRRSSTGAMARAMGGNPEAALRTPAGILRCGGGARLSTVAMTSGVRRDFADGAVLQRPLAQPDVKAGADDDRHADENPDIGRLVKDDPARGGHRDDLEIGKGRQHRSLGETVRDGDELMRDERGDADEDEAEPADRVHRPDPPLDGEGRDANRRDKPG